MQRVRTALLSLLATGHLGVNLKEVNRDDEVVFNSETMISKMMSKTFLQWTVLLYSESYLLILKIMSHVAHDQSIDLLMMFSWLSYNSSQNFSRFLKSKYFKNKRVESVLRSVDVPVVSDWCVKLFHKLFSFSWLL